MSTRALPSQDDALPARRAVAPVLAGHQSERAEVVLTSREPPAGGCPNPRPSAGALSAAVAKAKALVAKGKTPKWRELARAYGVHHDAVRHRVDGAYREKRNAIRSGRVLPSDAPLSFESVTRMVPVGIAVGVDSQGYAAVSVPRVKWLERPSP
jgi:hypothetical protein